MQGPGTSRCLHPRAHLDCPSPEWAPALVPGAQVLSGVMPAGPLLLNIHFPKGAPTWVVGTTQWCAPAVGFSSQRQAQPTEITVRRRNLTAWVQFPYADDGTCLAVCDAALWSETGTAQSSRTASWPRGAPSPRQFWRLPSSSSNQWDRRVPTVLSGWLPRAHGCLCRLYVVFRFMYCLWRSCLRWVSTSCKGL